MNYFDLLEQDTDNPEIQYEIYKACLEGNGNGKIEAMEWLTRAAQSGHEEAQKILKGINNEQENNNIPDFSNDSSIHLISLMSTNYYAAKELYRRNKDSCNFEDRIKLLKDICSFEESTAEDYDNLLKEITLKEFENPIFVDAFFFGNSINFRTQNNIDKENEFVKIYNNAQELGSKSADKYFANFFTYNNCNISINQLYMTTANYVSKSTYTDKLAFYFMLNSNKFSDLPNIDIIRSSWKIELLNSPEAKNYPFIYEFIKNSKDKNLLPIDDYNFNVLSNYALNKTNINDEIITIAFILGFSTCNYGLSSDKKTEDKLKTCKKVLEKSNIINDSDYIYSLLCKNTYNKINTVITKLQNKEKTQKIIFNKILTFANKNKSLIVKSTIVMIVMVLFFGSILNSINNSNKIDIEDYIIKDDIYYFCGDNNEVYVETEPESLLSWENLATKCSSDEEFIKNNFKCEFDTSNCLSNGTINYIVSWDYKEIKEEYDKKIDENNKLVITLNAKEDTDVNFINLFDYVNVNFYGYNGRCNVELTGSEKAQKIGGYTIQLSSNKAISTNSITNKSINDFSKNNELVYTIYKNSQIVATYVVYLDTSTLNMVATNNYKNISWYNISENSVIRLLAKAYDSSDSSIRVSNSKLLTVPKLGELLTTQNSLSKSSYNKLLSLAKMAMKGHNSHIENITNVYLIENNAATDKDDYKTAIIFCSNDLEYKNDYIYICNPTIDENGDILDNDSSGIHFEYKESYKTSSLKYAFNYSSMKILN